MLLFRLGAHHSVGVDGGREVFRGVDDGLPEQCLDFCFKMCHYLRLLSFCHQQFPIRLVPLTAQGLVGSRYAKRHHPGRLMRLLPLKLLALLSGGNTGGIPCYLVVLSLHHQEELLLCHPGRPPLQWHCHLAAICEHYLYLQYYYRPCHHLPQMPSSWLLSMCEVASPRTFSITTRFVLIETGWPPPKPLLDEI